MTLFTKKNCVKCDHVKSAFDLENMGVNIKLIEPDNADILAELAWYELLELVERGALPILVLDDGSNISSVVPIKKYLKKQLKAA